MSMVSEDFLLRIDGGKLQFSVHAVLNAYVDTRTSVLRRKQMCAQGFIQMYLIFCSYMKSCGSCGWRDCMGRVLMCV